MRYIAVDDSDHGCCFDASVVDTTKPVMIGGEHYKGRFERVCECYDEEGAKLIAEALNGAFLEAARACFMRTLDGNEVLDVDKLKQVLGLAVNPEAKHGS